MHQGADDHVAHHPTIASASNADMGGPRREDHLIGMRDRVGGPVGHVKAERLEGAGAQQLLHFPDVHIPDLRPPHLIMPPETRNSQPGASHGLYQREARARMSSGPKASAVGEWVVRAGEFWLTEISTSRLRALFTLRKEAVAR